MQDCEVLFVDDEEEILASIHNYLSVEGYTMHSVDSGLKALDLVREKRFDIVFTDLRMPEFSGLELLSAIKDYRPETEVIVMTGYGSIDSAVKALKLGCYDYLQKPIEFERIKVLIDRIVEKNKLKKENILIKRRLEERYKCGELVGVSTRMQEIFEIIDRITQSNSTVLIHGASGTGKELVAKIIHQNSVRKDNPFVAVNCGAIADGLLESELFGHVRGSFSGAIRDKAGLFRAAEGGTIFLDEIAEMAPTLQVKLLRTLQERKVRPVGDSKESDIDVRVIAATNRDPLEALRIGALRKDLFYRLNVVPITMPPLLERKEDIPLLINHFLQVFNLRNKKRIEHISPEAMEILLRYDWPGNVRELENVVERAFALGATDTITVKDLPSDLRKTGERPEANDEVYALRENEIGLIRV
jgi:two-component system response regulator PilR (NtrC family)